MTEKAQHHLAIVTPALFLTASCSFFGPPQDHIPNSIFIVSDNFEGLAWQRNGYSTRCASQKAVGSNLGRSAFK